MLKRKKCFEEEYIRTDDKYFCELLKYNQFLITTNIAIILALLNVVHKIPSHFSDRIIFIDIFISIFCSSTAFVLHFGKDHMDPQTSAGIIYRKKNAWRISGLTMTAAGEFALALPLLLNFSH